MMKEAKLAKYETRMGDLRVKALESGGEALLDRVDVALDVAARHVDRVRREQLPLTRGLVEEIECSFAIARDLLPKSH